jgi:hypothetical protein
LWTLARERSRLDSHTANDANGIKGKKQNKENKNFLKDTTQTLGCVMKL